LSSSGGEGDARATVSLCEKTLIYPRLLGPTASIENIVIIIIIMSRRRGQQVFLHRSHEGQFMTVGNIKFSLKLKVPLHKEEFLSLRRWDGRLTKGRPLDFVVLRSHDRPFVFTYFRSGHVNVTGVPDFDDIDEAVYQALRSVGRNTDDLREYPDGQPIKVDNVQGSGSFGRRLNLMSLAEYLQGKGVARSAGFTYRPDKFHGLKIRRPGAPGGMIVFASGKFTIVGVPDITEAARLWTHVKQLVNESLADEGRSPLPEVTTPVQDRKSDEDRTPPGAPNVLVASAGGENELPGRHVARKRSMRPFRRFWLDEDSVDEDKENEEVEVAVVEDGGEEYRHKKFRAAGEQQQE
jgi:TATA-box binding protein (TBP) (component of TFIID and TFIIIB)